VIVGDADLVSGVLAASEASDTAELTGAIEGEVAPPVSAAIGGHWRPEPHRPPPVEGVGYGILPQLEGEAHGLVGVAGAGAASQSPGLVGVGAGAVGVVGRSTARLAIKAAAVGDRGQAGSGLGTIVGIKAAAIGRHDDDAAAIVAILLAA